MSEDVRWRALENRFGKLEIAAMQVEDIDEVVQIESGVYAHPWTRGNFLDSLRSGYQALTLRDASRRLLGYVLIMQAVDEAHLLNISVAKDVQGLGIGRTLLDLAVDLTRTNHMLTLLLEVRVSNTRALQVYRQYGFVEIGRRKHYYAVDQHTREDAIVMSLPL